MRANRIKSFRSIESSECIEHKQSAVRVGISSDGYGEELKSHLVVAMELAGHHVVDFTGFGRINHGPDAEFIVPMAESIATGRSRFRIKIDGD